MPSERFIANKRMPEQLDLTAQVERLRKVLAKRKKVELIEALVDLAIDERKVLRQLESRFDVQAPADDLVKSTRQAITDATAFSTLR